MEIVCAECVNYGQAVMERPDACDSAVVDTRTPDEIQAAIKADESRARAIVLEMVRCSYAVALLSCVARVIGTPWLHNVTM